MSSQRSVSPRSASRPATASLVEENAKKVKELKRLSTVRREQLELMAHLQLLGSRSEAHSQRMSEGIAMLKEEEKHVFSPVPKQYKGKSSTPRNTTYADVTPRTSTQNELAVKRDHSIHRPDFEHMKPLPLEPTLEQIVRGNRKRFGGVTPRYTAAPPPPADTLEYKDPTTGTTLTRRQIVEQRRAEGSSKWIKQVRKPQWDYQPKPAKKVPVDFIPTCATPR